MAVRMLTRPRFLLQVPDLDSIDDEMIASRKNVGMAELISASPPVQEIREDVWEGFVRLVFRFWERLRFWSCLPNPAGESLDMEAHLFRSLAGGRFDPVVSLIERHSEI